MRGEGWRHYILYEEYIYLRVLNIVLYFISMILQVYII